MKKEIVERLLKANQITFDEALLLMDNETLNKTTVIQPYKPLESPYNTGENTWWQFPQITC